MSCEVYLDSNAEEYEITVSGDDTCAEFEVIVELEGETIPTETDPVFLAHPVYAMDASDVSNLHAPGSDAETLSTIGTLLDTAATGAPASGDSFPWVQSIGHTLKKISYGNLLTAISSVVGSEPLFTASEAATITSGDTTNWDTAYGWGDHSVAGYASSSDLLNYSTTGHAHATLYDPIGTASGEVGQHEIDYDHTTFITTSALDGYATSGDLLNYSATGHDHATVYDIIGAASGEVGQHEIDYDHSGFLTSTDLLDYSTTGHTHSTLYDPIGSASGAVGQHEIDFVHGDYLTSGDLPDYSAVYLGINAKAADSDKLDGFDSTYFSATGHTHSYDILGAASGEVGQHEIDYDHTLIATALQSDDLDGYATTGNLLDYSTTGHTHSTLYDAIGSASGEIGQHEIDYVHGDYLTSGDLSEMIGFALSDEVTSLTAGQKLALDFPTDYVVTSYYGSLVTAASGSLLQVDIEDEGTSILNSVLSFADGSTNASGCSFSGEAASYTIHAGDLISFDIDQVGSTTAGKGLKIFLKGYIP